VILENPAWHGYNTSVCRADDRFVMVFELGAPAELVGEPFTMFFAESKDLVNWTWIEDAVFGKEFYTGGPMVRYFDGYFYMFYLDGSYEKTFKTFVARSTDLKNWTISPKNPVLSYDEDDRKLLGDFNLEFTRHIANSVNINASDLDMCEYNGKLELIYSWGCQRGIEFLARAQSDLSEKEFCEYFFK
jgi:beta-xylosidase